MKKARKALLTLCAALLLVTMTVGVTVAYLMDDSDLVTNTFTIGSVEITLDELPVNLYGEEVDGERTTANVYKLIPGHNYVKDPTVHVVEGSEECYLFVAVENDIEDIEAPDTIAAQMTANGWTLLTGNIYYYATTVDAREEAVDKVVFSNFTVAGDADVADYEGATVTVKAYAVQADGFEDTNENGTAADEAWAATYGA